MNNKIFLELNFQLFVNWWMLSANKLVKKGFSDKYTPFYCFLTGSVSS